MEKGISDRTLREMDKAIENYKEGKVSKPIDLFDFRWGQVLPRKRNKKRLSVKEIIQHKLEKELKKASKGAMPKQTRKALAIRTVNRMDFNNSLQMHKSIEAYADILVANWRREMDKKYEEFRKRLDSVPDVYDGFKAAVMTHVKFKESRLEVVNKYMDNNPTASTSDILEYISDQPDFYEDTAWPKLTVHNLIPCIKMRLWVWLRLLKKRKR